MCGFIVVVFILLFFKNIFGGVVLGGQYFIYFFLRPTPITPTNVVKQVMPILIVLSGTSCVVYDESFQYHCSF